MVDFVPADNAISGIEPDPTAPRAGYAPSSFGERLSSGVADATYRLNDWLQQQAATGTRENPEGLQPFSLGTDLPLYQPPQAPAQFVDPKALQKQFPGVKGLDQPLPVDVAQTMADEQAREQKQQEVMARSPGGVGGFIQNTSADVLASFLDPVGDAAFMVPVVGEARYAAWLSRAGEAAGVFGRGAVAAGVGAARGATGGAILSGGRYLGDPDFTLGDAASQTLNLALIGGIAHTGLDLAKGAIGLPSDILGTRLLESEEGRAAHAQADLHDAATRTAAAQIAGGLNVEARSPFDLTAYHADLMSALRSGASPDAMPLPKPEAVTRFDEARAAAAGEPTQAEVQRAAEIAAAKLPPDEAAEAAELERWLNTARANGTLTPEGDARIAEFEPPQKSATEAPNDQASTIGASRIPGAVQTAPDALREVSGIGARAGAALVQPVPSSGAEGAPALTPGAESYLESASADIDAGSEARPQDQSLFTRIRRAGGIKLTGPDGQLTPEGQEVRAALKDTPNYGLIDNKRGIPPDKLRHTLQQEGWFGPPPPEGERVGEHPGDDLRDLYDKLNEQARGNPVYHPQSDIHERLAERRQIDADMAHAGVGSADSREVAATKLANYRAARAAELESWHAEAARAGLHVPDDARAPEILRAAIEHDFPRAIEEGHGDEYAKEAEGWIDERIANIDPDEYARYIADGLGAEPEAAEFSAAGGYEPGSDVGAEAGLRESGGEPTADRELPHGQSGAGQRALGVGEVETDAERAAREGRKAIEESQQLPRANSGREQKPANEGLFAPPPPANRTLFQVDRRRGAGGGRESGEQTPVGHIGQDTERRMVDAYNENLPSIDEQYGYHKNSSYQVLDREEAESIYGDYEDVPEQLRDIIQKHGSAVEISDGNNVEVFPPSEAPSLAEHKREVVQNDGGAFPAESHDDIMRGLATQHRGTEYGSAEAFKVLAKDRGWNIRRQPHADFRYMEASRDLSPDEIADLKSRGVTNEDGDAPVSIEIGVRVSDHARTSAQGRAIHGKAPVHINIAPGADDFSDAAKALDLAHYNDDGEISLRDDGKRAALFQRQAIGGGENFDRTGPKVALLDHVIAQMPEQPSPAEQRVIDKVNEIARRILPPDTEVHAARSIESTEGLRDTSGSAEGGKITGVMTTNGTRRIIAWSLESPDAPGTIRHEAMHDLRRLLTSQEWSALEKASNENGWQERFDIANRYPGADESLRTEESIADAYGHWQIDPSWLPEPLRPIFAKIGLLLHRVADFIRSTFGGDVTANDVFSRIESGQIAQRSPSDPAGGEASFAQSQRAPDEEEKPEEAASRVRARLTAIRDEKKYADIMRYVGEVRAQGYGLHLGVLAKMRSISESIEGARDGTEGHKNVNQEKYIGALIGGLEKVPGALKAWSSRAMTDDWLAEKFELEKQGGKPGVTNSPMALKIAQVVKDAQDLARAEGNKAGAFTGDYDGYISRTAHNPIEIDRAGYEAWRDFTLDNLDQARTFAGLSPAEIEQFMKGSWNALSTGRHFSSANGVPKLGTVPGGANLARRMSAERVFHWKDAASWAAYQRRFGQPDIELGISLSLMRAARDVALMDRWGSNPQAMFARILKDIGDKYRDDHAALRVFDANQAKLQGEFDELSGKNSTAQNDLSVRIARAATMIENVADLNNVVFAHMSVGATKPYQLRFMGMGRWQAYTAAIRNIVQDKSPEGRAIMENLHSNATGRIQDMLHGYDPFNSVPGLISRIEAFNLRLGLLPQLLGREKAGTKWEVANLFGQNIGKGFDELNQQMQRTLKLHSISPVEWDALRTAPDHDRGAHGIQFLTPKAADRATPAAIDAIDPGRMAGAATPEDAERMRGDIRDRLGMKLATLYSDAADRSTITPGIAERAMFNRRLGPIGGPLVGQYKTWATAAIRQMWGPAIKGMSRAEGVKALAALAATMTAMGALRSSVQDVLKGEYPDIPNGDAGHDARLLARWTTAGGGLGIFGDAILGLMVGSQKGSDVLLKALEMAAGPVISDVAETGKIVKDTFSNAARGGDEALRSFIHHLPVVNTFYIRQVMNWLFLDRLQEATNPGYLERYQARVRAETGQHFFMAPSSSYLGAPANQGAQQ